VRSRVYTEAEIVVSRGFPLEGKRLKADKPPKQARVLNRTKFYTRPNI